MSLRIMDFTVAIINIETDHQQQQQHKIDEMHTWHWVQFYRKQKRPTHVFYSNKLTSFKDSKERNTVMHSICIVSMSIILHSLSLSNVLSIALHCTAPYCNYIDII